MILDSLSPSPAVPGASGSDTEPLVPRLRGMSHAIAFLLSVAGTVLVLALAPTARTTVALAVYGAGLMALFGGSALYHRWPGPARFKTVLQRVDHSMIFVFIAATYTPIALVVLHGAVSWIVLGAAWAGAAAGVAFSLGWIGASRGIITASYLSLGWIAVIAIPQLLQALGTVPLVLFAAGGVLYSVGAIVYLKRRPDPWPRTFGFHELFHALVIAAAATQYIAIIGWVVPASRV
ncbi:MAG: PAQR family membrane homeostasis protein TrhA [Solirubrobacteraceae bacterium]